jgi:hypothetical protein
MGADAKAAIFSSRAPMPLQQVQSRMRKLTELWKTAAIEAYTEEGRLFLSECRELIRAKASRQTVSWPWINCLEAVVTVQHHLGNSVEEAILSDEDLLLNVYGRYTPLAKYLSAYLYKCDNFTSNIYKRRACVLAREGRLAKATAQMEEAVREAQQAVQHATTVEACRSAATHVSYLQYRAAILKMLAAETSKDFPHALQELQVARDAAKEPSSPVSYYIWDRNDLDTYHHLLNAQLSLFAKDWATAIHQYDIWLENNRAHSGQFRFKNAQVRHDLASVAHCLAKICAGCKECRSASNRLKQLGQDPIIGDAGRYLAATGVALHQLGSSDLERVFDRIRDSLPNLGYYWQPRVKNPENDVDSLPDYFSLLPMELKRLKEAGATNENLQSHLIQRLREFIEICCEYEESVSPHLQPPASRKNVPMRDLVARIIDARMRYRGKDSKGAASWRSALPTVDGIEISSYSEALNGYRFVLAEVAGLFPLIVRLTSREKSEAGWSAQAETIEGDDFKILSQFPLEGTWGYLSHRWRHNLSAGLSLQKRGRREYIPATKPDWLEIGSIPLWEGDWSRIGREFECATLDYKEAKPIKLAKHIAAFANSGGGWLQFGIEDPRRREAEDAAGIKVLKKTDVSDILDSVENAAFAMTDPPAWIRFYRSYPDGRNVVPLCEIPVSKFGPHRVGGRIYVRLGSQSVPLDDSEWIAFAKRREAWADSA